MSRTGVEFGLGGGGGGGVFPGILMKFCNKGQITSFECCQQAGL